MSRVQRPTRRNIGHFGGGLVVVVVVIIDLHGASRSTSIALLVPTALRKDEFSDHLWNCRYTEQGTGVSLKASSIPSDPYRRPLNGRLMLRAAVRLPVKICDFRLGLWPTLYAGPVRDAQRR